MVLQLHRVKLSRALKGSSSSSTDGLRARARAMRDALSHAARQLAGQRVGEVGESHVPQKVDDGGVLRSGREFEKREPHVLPHRQPRHEPRLLEHNANVASGSGHSLAPQGQVAVGRRLDPGNDPQQGSLAAARSRRPGQRPRARRPRDQRGRAPRACIPVSSS